MNFGDPRTWVLKSRDKDSSLFAVIGEMTFGEVYAYCERHFPVLLENDQILVTALSD